MKTDLIEPGDNEDITAERRKASIKVNEMANFVHGGEDIVRRRHEILAFVESRPEFRDAVPLVFLSREQRYEEQARKAVAMTDLALENIDGSDFFGEGMYYQSLVMGRDLHAMSLHYVMFLPTLQGQANDEQLDEWLGLAISRGILGTYAQTELGHGTNLSRLETTATYDPKTEEFVLHSPTVTSAKWWPGSLGKSSNFAVVMAQLITRNTCHGPHPFIVQLREMDSHKPFKTIQVGDIGPKFGINGSDNGFLIFKNHRIPRTNLLMRHAKVLASGEYVAPKHNKLGYGSMVFVRSIMIRDQAMLLGAAATIATRYAAIRRQGETSDSGGKEVQILDYQTQQYRILPHIAATLVFLFAASEIRSLYLKVTEQLLIGDVQLLAEMHALSSGLKSVISWEVAKGIEQCRLACGGHGYSQASAFPDIYAYAVGGCTYEGENIVMLLQVARQLMKAAASVRQGRAHLLHLESYLSEPPLTGADFGDDFARIDSIQPKHLVKIFENAARIQIFRVFDFLEGLRAKNVASHQAWNRTSVELCRASRLHVKAYLVRNYFEQARAADVRIARVCGDLGKLFALYHITTSPKYFAKFLSVSQMEALQTSVYDLLARLRPDCVAIVDAFDFSDRELDSVLGRRDGNVYAALLEWAKQSPLNRTEVTSAYEKYLRPMMLEGRSKI